MSRKKQESELSDLVSLNEEMQSIWTEKESEVREILERFSAYRDAVEADSKEKDELYLEELNRREAFIKELELSKNDLEKELRQKDEAFAQLIKYVEQLETARLREFQEIEEVVCGFSEKINHTQSNAKLMCQTISVRLRDVIAECKKTDYTKYLNGDFVARHDCRGYSEETKRLESKVGDASMHTSQTFNEKQDKRKDALVLIDNELCVSQELEDFTEERDPQQLSSVDTPNSILRPLEYSSADPPKSDGIASASHTAHAEGTQEDKVLINSQVFKSTELVSDLPYSVQDDQIRRISDSEHVQEDVADLMRQIEGEKIEYGAKTDEEEDGLVEACVDRKTVVKLLEEQWTRYQLACKEKDDEIQHWRKKHKQDTKDLQDILEEQDRAELKNNETLAELQAEVDKLRQRNKFLESEVEVTKEQGEDEVCILRESFQKNLSDMLRRQSQSFLSVEEASRSQVAELEARNEELRRENDDLRRQIADHCTEIKSWVSGILLLTEEEYNEEFHTISDVLGKLQKIILDNKRTIDDLQGELSERGKLDRNQPTSPTDEFLGHSWGGYSWNSLDSQKDICPNCKQAKWRRVLMGSFDMIEEGLGARQDEVEKFVAKMDLAEAKYRKKQSLRDSLELADTSNEMIRRLGEQSWNSLGTVGEHSLEGSDKARDRVHVGSQDALRDGENEVTGDQAWGLDSTKVSQGNDKSVSGLHDSGGDFSGSIDRDQVDGPRRDDIGFGGNIENEEVEGRRESGHKIRDIEETNVKDEEDDEGNEVIKEEDEEDKEDLVHVVNLYRSLIVENYNPDIGNESEVESNKSQSSVNLVDVTEDKRGDGKLIDDESVGIFTCPNFVGNSYEDPKEDSILIPKIVLHDEHSENVAEEYVSGNMNDKAVENGAETDLTKTDWNNFEFSDIKRSDGVPHWNDSDHLTEEYVNDIMKDEVIENSPKADPNKIDQNRTEFLDTKTSGWVSQENKSENLTEEYANNDTKDKDTGNSRETDSTKMDQKIFESFELTKFSDGSLDNELLDGCANAEMNDELITTRLKTEATKTAEKSFELLESKEFVKGDREKILESREEEFRLNRVSSVEKHQSEHDTSELSKLDVDSEEPLVISEKSIGDFHGNFEDSVSFESCSHCSRCFRKYLTDFKKSVERLLEVRTEEANKTEVQILRQLEGAKEEVDSYRKRYEELEKVCEDYLTRLDEYSENLRNKNAELRRLELTSGIMKTEVEWLRQALGITTNYDDFSKGF